MSALRDPRTSPLRVLIIDDSEIARAHLRQIVEGAGMDAFEQASGIGATRYILQSAIDVVVVDVNMPGLSGDRLVALLRENKRLGRLAIVVVSAKPQDELAALGMAADAVISKERAEAELPGLLRALCEKARGAARAEVRSNHA